MNISFAKDFKKGIEKADSKIRQTFNKRVELFTKDPFSPQLNNHQLTGEYKGFRSINITGDWRALYTEEIINGELWYVFRFLGTHSQLYK